MTDHPTLFDLGGTSADDSAPADAPLAEQMRPRSLDDLVGLDDVVKPGTFLRETIESDRVPSIIFWGPPGSGKTTLARIIARSTSSRFVPFSAVTSGIKEVREIMRSAQREREQRGARTLLFIDEIHRFNRAQQDAFLPYVEAGDVILIGATTENPSFEVNSALLSRCRVIVLPQLEEGAIVRILERALDHEIVRSSDVEFPQQTLRYLASISSGDARQALNGLEILSRTLDPGSVAGLETAQRILKRRSLRFDKSGEMHYDIISALHKSIRNGDADAAVYWLARMLEGGEDPMYVARRLVRAASEDVGLADPEALKLAVAAKEAAHFIGMPEAGVVLAELVIYLAGAPKSNSAYRAWGSAVREISESGDLPVPLEIRNAPTRLMKNLGYGSGYEYAHAREEKTTSLRCLPENLEGRRFYESKREGVEEEISERLEAWRDIRERLRKEE
ncbi:MAG: replication-associated recombination protein A [Thermoanaerobaculia bacterium]|nr:replication-associated recombination protein A [Thermoanaerobaculia bacterium]